MFCIKHTLNTLPAPGKKPSGERPLGQAPWVVEGLWAVSPLNGDLGSLSRPDWAATSFQSCWISVGDIIPGGYKNGLVRKNMIVISCATPNQCFSLFFFFFLSPSFSLTPNYCQCFELSLVVSGRKFNQCSWFPSMINNASVVFSPQQ